MGLNNAQQEAVSAPPDAILQILAGPGSGKTKVLTHRVCFLLEQGMKPENIILTTFTNKAANEMKERIAKLGCNGVESQLITGTFHSICRRYLVKYGSMIDLPRGWGIADTDDSIAILKRVLKEMRSSIEPNNARNIISSLKSNGISSEQYRENSASSYSSQQRTVKSEISFEMTQVYQMYEDKLEAMNLLDFDDLLLRTCTLLSLRPQCISNIQHILVDEFQDTNKVQYTLMRLFAQKCGAISIVGDPDQGIYGWRSANVGNMKQMRLDYEDVVVVSLEENYRSSTWILKLAVAVIEQDSARFAKTLLSTKAWGSQPVLRTLADVHVEARWIAREVKRIIGITGRMITEKDVAILVRTANMTRPIESGLASAGIRYRIVGGRKFFDREEIRDMLAYLKVIHSLKDRQALVRIINVPNRRLGDARVAVLVKDSDTKSRPMWDSIHALVTGEIRFAMKDAAAEAALALFVRNIETARKKLSSKEIKTVSDLIDYIRTQVNYDDHIRKKFGAEADERIGNLEELKTFAKEIELMVEENPLPDIGIGENEEEESALDRFLGNIALMTDIREDHGGDEKIACITISTIHAAKGLEWPVVFIPGVYQGSIPHLRAEDVDEERRLLYVAMTRAQSLLYLTFPAKNGLGDIQKLSVFIEQPNVGKLLATRGGALDVGILASILGRPVPTKEDISKACVSLTSLHDEDWVKDNFDKSSGVGPFGEGGAAQRIREWRPQTTVSALNTTQVGFSNGSISRSTSINGLGGLTSSNPTTGTPMGFMTSRQALAILPPEQLTAQTNSRKRKSESISGASLKQKPLQQKLTILEKCHTTPALWSQPTARAQSSGVIQDRGKPAKTKITLPTQQSSSPSSGYDVDELPPVKFSSPDPSTADDEEFCSLTPKPATRLGNNDIPSALVSSCNPIRIASAQKQGEDSSDIKGLSTGRKSLGVARGAKPWPMRTF